MAKFHRVDSDVSVRSSVGSILASSNAANVDTLPLRNTSSTLLYELPDSPRGTDVPRQSSASALLSRSTDALRQSSVSSLCFDASTGAGNHLEQAVRHELLTRPWSVNPQRSPSIQLPPHRSVASPLITAGLDPVHVDVHQRPVNHSTAERRFGDARDEPLITLDDLGDVPSPMPRQSVPEPREVPPVRSRGAWEGMDVGRRHHHSSRRSPPTRRRRHHHRSSSSSSSSSSSLHQRGAA